MIQIYADGVLAYDSRLQDYALLGLTHTGGVNKGGTATIIMPPGHPAYSKYTSARTIVEITRDGSVLFRGRALYPTDNFNNTRTVLCEGELCLFQDGVSRPYLYQDTPAAIFSAVVSDYNAQVESFKQFKVGNITVTDPNDYIRLESETAEQSSDTINKLLERCGGYIVFTTDPDDGLRVVNWYAELEYANNQTIEFGENLLDFSRSGANTDLMTGIIPYGAKDETTGQRVTIESANDGVDYIIDEAAQSLRGTILKPVYWEDVTDPTNLLHKAQAYLTENRKVVTSLQLSAVDLSYLDKSFDSFRVGDTVRVRSKPHEVDEDFQLTERTEDLLNPASSSITLGKEVRTLTDADVAGDKQSQNSIQKVQHDIKVDYTLGIASAVAEAERTLSSVIKQASDSILLQVSDSYTTNEQLTEQISTSLTQLSDSFTFRFEQLRAVVDANDAEAQARLNEIYHYISFENGDIKLGASDSAITLTLENDQIVFRKNGEQFGWWDGDYFHTGNIVVKVNEQARLGNFAYVPRTDGSLQFLKVGG